MIRWKPKFSLVSMVSGMLLGLSILVLLHQNGTLYPTRMSVVYAAVAGLLVGILVPSLRRLFAVRKANASIRARVAAARR
jgi:predicted membrane-bound spermidine synthase